MSSNFLESVVVRVLADNQVMFGTPYIGQHGVSILVSAYRQDSKLNVLVDVGGNGDAVLRNMGLMGVNPRDVDVIVLTHRHKDHAGGLFKVLEAVGKEDLPIIAHPDIMRPNISLEPHIRYIGTPADFKERVTRLGGVLILTRDPLELVPGLMTTGEVRRFRPARYEFKTFTEDFRLVNDEMLDDTSLIALLRDGLVLITGCSHSGITNVVRHSIELTKIRKVKAIVGGLHLVKTPEEEIAEIVEELTRHEIEMVFAGHCTGFKAQVELSRRYGDKFTPLQVGMELVFK
ncbi:MAG: MBL fold metallo-hydrolase [Zestosphaera sp.]